MSRDTEYADDRDADRTPYDDAYGEANTYDDDRTLPGFLPFGWPAAFPGGTTDDEYRGEYDEEYRGKEYRDDEYRGDEYRDRDAYDEDEGTWLDEGLITLTIIAGVALFLFPEPATSGLGVLLIGVGVLAWIVDWALT